jgi:nucleotide-binding universal stress UspA family protein
MFRNIIVSVDGSSHADRALSEAIDIAIGSHARLTVMSGVPTTHGWSYAPANAMALESLAADLERESTELLRAAVDRVPEDIGVTSLLVYEPIRKALLHQIEAGNHDLLVMGSRGRGAVSSTLLGSVSHFMLNHCRIPVLIVHEEDDTEAPVLEADIDPEGAQASPAG